MNSRLEVGDPGRSQVLGIILQPFSARHSGFIVQPLPQVAHHCAKLLTQLGHVTRRRDGSQSAVLGMHAIQRRPVAIGEGASERVEIRPMMYVALTYDHRLVDGREAVSFLVRIKQTLEDPARMLMEV